MTKFKNGDLVVHKYYYNTGKYIIYKLVNKSLNGDFEWLYYNHVNRTDIIYRSGYSFGYCGLNENSWMIYPEPIKRRNHLPYWMKE